MPDAPARSATREERERALSFAARLSLPVIDRAWQVLGKGIEEVRQSPRALAAADMVLVRLAHLADLPTPDEALRRLGQAGASAMNASAPRISASAEPRSPAPVARASGSAQRQPDVYASPAPQAAPQTSPVAMFQTFPDVIARAAAERDIQLKTALERDVRLVRFEDGSIEFSLAPGGSPELVQKLMRKLGEWTGRRWMVTLSRAEGAPSLREEADAKRREREIGVAQHPLVRSVMERFPGAEIVAVRDGVAAEEAAPVPVLAQAHADAGEDILYDDSADPSDDNDF